ncbi:hypothetical protein BpHYR1_001322 [Brachionus plicatilis]|uniref:Uncharacterized protein n=1 Tax=Brachionus plicatilis TaxID=10195 RepID=A0A3M7T7D4_BRAPC|nr:hypothetical protein BpHYR1_001322 [Brachionus plicatilis]
MIKTNIQMTAISLEITIQIQNCLDQVCESDAILSFETLILQRKLHETPKAISLLLPQTQLDHISKHEEIS